MIPAKINKYFFFVLAAGIFLFPLTSFASFEISDGNVQYLYHENSDGTDSSGNGHNLTDTSMTYSTGKLGNGAYFDGVASVQKVNSFPRGSGDYTWTFWLNIHDFKTSTRLELWDWTTVFNALFFTTASDKKFNVQLNGHSAITSTSLATSTWYFIGIQRVGTAGYLYVNNTLMSSTSSLAGIASPSSNLSYGDDLSGTSRSDIVMDEIMGYNGVLSSSTMSALYNSGNGQEICVTAGCGATSTEESSTSTDCFLGSETTDWTLIEKAVLMVFYFIFIILIISLSMIFLRKSKKLIP